MLQYTKKEMTYITCRHLGNNDFKAKLPGLYAGELVLADDTDPCSLPPP